MNSAQLLPNVFQTWVNSNGAPIAGGQLYSYIAGTTTPQATYTDEGAGTPNANPTILNAGGQASVWLRCDLAYKLKMLDASNNVLWTVDNVSIVNAGSIDKTKIAANVAGAALAQNNSTLAIDVQVDNATIGVNVSNQLFIPTGGITPDKFSASTKFEVLVKNVRDLTCPGLFQQIPQYEWSTPTKITNPGILPPGAASIARWSPNGEFLAVGSGTSTYLDIYQRSGIVLTKLPDPGTLPTGAVYDLGWSPCGDFLAIAHNTNPKLTIYQRSGNSFTKLSDPASLPSPSHGVTNARIMFSPNSDFLTIGFSAGTSTGLIIYERSGTTFTDVTSGSGLSGIEWPVAWSGDSSVFAAFDITTGGIDVYTRADAVFTGITGPNVSSYFTDITGFSFSSDGNFLAVSVSITPFILIFQITSNTFSQLSNPATLPPDVANCVSWSANSEYLVVGHNTTPFMTIYSVSGATFTKIANPSSLPAAAILGADWTQTKQFLAVVSGTTPFVQVYQTASTLSSDAFLWIREAPNV